jgi:hypothetical protein
MALWYLSRLKYALISSAYADLEVVIESHNESLKQALQLLLDLPNVQVQEAFEDRNRSYIITVISTEKGTRCHKYGKTHRKAKWSRRVHNAPSFRYSWQTSLLENSSSTLPM